MIAPQGDAKTNATKAFTILYRQRSNVSKGKDDLLLHGPKKWNALLFVLDIKRSLMIF